MCAAWLMVVPSAQSKLQPYFVLRSTEFGNVKPRILFVLDSSNSMQRTAATSVFCTWNGCEGNDPNLESRMAAARRAMKTVVDSAGELASFGLMTFEQHVPPSTVPTKCERLTDGGWIQTRFAWVDTIQRGASTTAIEHYPGYQGSWALCDGTTNLPYPYLRWDELGNGSEIAADDQTGTVPASPLVSTAQVDMKSFGNATRRVQWFPRFMGVRANLNAQTDPGGTVLAGTVGDYATTASERSADVWQQDFYYWPYVDGFPGYSAWYASDSTGHTSPTHQPAGVTSGSPTYAAQLYAPFYLDLEDTAVPLEKRGPADVESARVAVSQFVSPMIEGGIDPHSGGITPWKTTIGVIPDAVTNDNSESSHASVASYLKFVTSTGSDSVCAPTSVVLLTDGAPYPAAEGGDGLYARLSALRRDLGVKVYVVGMFQATAGQLNHMACAAAGACDGTCSSPCDDAPADNWDTCSDPADPQHNCAYLISSADALANTLNDIIKESLDLVVDAGRTLAINDFGVGAEGDLGKGEMVQTSVRAFTDWPGWHGHVERVLCDEVDADGNPKPFCDPTAAATFDAAEERFGPCPQSRTWDAGACLQQTTWNDRRLFTSGPDNTLIAVAEPDGTATAQFTAELARQEIIKPGYAEGADAIAGFILGKDWPDAWKLPGLANATPVVTRRVPRLTPHATPSVPIRDAHCSGRAFTADTDVPDSLEDFARDAWGYAGRLTTPSEHYEYQEAVLVGDDLGVLHAFQLDSGNELWGYLPPALLKGAASQAAIGAASLGQPAEIEDHKYGIAATPNHGYAWDAVNEQWRHLLVFGLGAGGSHYVALDISHMSPESPSGPFEVLWSSDQLAAYTGALGETWARPALTYAVPDDSPTALPQAKIVMASGYAETAAESFLASASLLDAAPSPSEKQPLGRTLIVADALTGVVEQSAAVSLPARATRYDSEFGLVGDPAVASHCLSRFWAEMQEVYVADPAGRLFRWDLGVDTDHAADSGATWGDDATPAATFRACTGAGGTCTVPSTGGGDLFTFGPAVSGVDRIDATTVGAVPTPPVRDQLLVALASGSAYDDAIGAEAVPVSRTVPDGRNFHSSLYLLVDDHSAGDAHGGFDIPSGAPLSSTGNLGQYAGYMRLALSQVTRTRTYTPYEGGPSYTDTRTFGKLTRPTRPPRVAVRAIVDRETGEVVDGVELFEITFTVYEPGEEAACDPKWYDASSGTWHYDEGSTYEIAFQLPASSTYGMDFTYGASGGADGTAAYDLGDDITQGLALTSVTQVAARDCADGVCGPRPHADPMPPCDRNEDAPGEPLVATVPTSQRFISGFSPVE